ncbi:response regulator [Epidermidibacterium keratini]|uniref:Response regulator n=1 Tax=Epidermidibacterium keratini TaxID=1891644 RepID=A0A7L4YLW8_9ACTN|nr:response regulator [Epidermidibacterium keratini]QHB99823.1 response regulator [Epidermidibacterium keratini]
MRVLIIEDEVPLRRALGINLRSNGYDVLLAANGAEGLAHAASEHPDAVILDLGLPDIDGMEVIEGIRGWSGVPLIVLSARHTSQEKVRALDAGADDYLTKPFNMDELLARVRVAVRRAPAAGTESTVRTADFEIDLAAKQVIRDGTSVRLTPTEWAIVETLVRHPRELVSQRQLLLDVWGPAYSSETNYLRVYLTHVRRKLEPDPRRPRYFITEPGMGYRFEP